MDMETALSRASLNMHVEGMHFTEKEKRCINKHLEYLYGVGYDNGRKERIEKNTSIEKKDLGVNDIFNAVADFYDISPDLLMKNTRGNNLPSKRSVFFILAKKLTKCSLAELGMIAGGIDHATVLHHLNKYWNIYDSDTMSQKYKQGILFQKNLALDEINTTLAEDFRKVDIIKFHQNLKS